MLKRDKEYFDSIIELKDGSYYAKEAVNIEFPKWYQDKQLFDIADNTYLYGVFCFTTDTKYCVSRIPTILVTTPIMVTEIERDGVMYFQLKYGKGDKVIDSEKVIQHSFLSFNFFDSFYMQAKPAWFLAYEDFCLILDNMVQYGASNLGANLVTNEVVTSFIARLAQNKSLFYRTVGEGNPVIVDLMDVRYSTLSTVSKMAGNYLSEAIVSTLVQHEKKPNKLESHVRTNA